MSDEVCTIGVFLGVIEFHICRYVANLYCLGFFPWIVAEITVVNRQRAGPLGGGTGTQKPPLCLCTTVGVSLVCLY